MFVQRNQAQSKGDRALTSREYTKLVGFMNYLTLTFLQLMQGAKGWEQKSGAVFAVASRSSGQPLFPPRFIGAVPAEKSEKYVRLASVVKPRQLMDNPNHLCSWQSRDPESGLWGGAIAVSPDEIFSMSGLTEHGDEGLVSAGAHAYCGDIILPGLDEIARISSNPHWATLRLLQAQI